MINPSILRAVRLKPFRYRGLAEASLDGSAIETFKSDQRSRVWSVDAAGGTVVVKRFEFAPIKQRLSALIGRHPAQLELSWNQKLRNAKLPIVPIVDGGIEPCRLGCRVWLATLRAGTSLQRLLQRGRSDEAQCSAAINAAAQLTVSLIDAGFWFKDLKPSNIVIDVSGEAWLIDVGSARRSNHRQNVDRMLIVMQRVLLRDEVNEDLRERFASTVRRALGEV